MLKARSHFVRAIEILENADPNDPLYYKRDKLLAEASESLKRLDTIL